MSVTELDLHPNPFPDHVLFDGHGGSWDGEFQGEPSRYGVVEAGYQTVSRVKSPKVIKVLSGTASFADTPVEPDEYFSFPVDQAFHLKIGTAEPFVYISRQAEAETCALQCQQTLDQLATQGIGTAEWFALPRDHQYEKLAALVGHTPVAAIELGDAQTVTTKQEFANPSGSHYDRAYLRTLQTLEAEGFLQAGDELRDITSGSAGISLALIGHLLGFRVRITVPDELPANRIYPMLAYGAQVISAGSGYVPAAAEHQTTEIDSLKIDPAYQLSRPRTRASRAFMFQSSHERLCYLNHSENELSPQAFSAIGQELVQQVTDVPEALLLAIGNWTTIAGIVPVIRQAWPDTQIIGYEGEVTDRPHRNYGTTVLGVRLRYEQAGLLDQRLMVSDQERDEVDYLVNTDRSLADQLGHSSLMGLALAKRLHRHGISGNIVTIAYDQKFRY